LYSNHIQLKEKSQNKVLATERKYLTL
jgi:hypothetical protein